MTDVAAPLDPVSEAFFARPPWAGGVPRYKVGLAPIPVETWLPEAATASDVSRKSDLYASRLEEVCAVLDAAQPHLQASIEMLRAHCSSRRFATPDHGGLPLLAAAALWVPDDLCLMVKSEGRYRLAAASLCAPSFWTLRDKLGSELSELHGGHDGLNEVLGARMQEVFDRLPEGRVLERRNWFLHGPSTLFEPRDRMIEPVANIADHIVRSERQTLRRLNADCIIFSIRVRQIPFAGISGFPDSAADMAKTVRALTDMERKAFSLRERVPQLLEFLDAVAARSAATRPVSSKAR